MSHFNKPYSAEYICELSDELSSLESRLVNMLESVRKAISQLDNMKILDREDDPFEDEESSSNEEKKRGKYRHRTLTQCKYIFPRGRNAGKRCERHTKGDYCSRHDPDYLKSNSKKALSLYYKNKANEKKRLK